MEMRMKFYAGIIGKHLGNMVSAQRQLSIYAKSIESLTLGGDICAQIREDVNILMSIAKELELSVTPSKASTLLQSLSHGKNPTECGVRMRDFQETLVQELNSIQFLPASADMIKYHGKSALFGELVAVAFSECSEDISEAHECLAFERYTACVFHAGRAMELATARLAKRMRVGKPDDDWQGFLKAINKAIDAMPYRTKQEREKRTPYAEAAGFSFQFKEAWRNPTAHPKRTYTRQEALDVMNGARAFMDAVARKIFKVRVPKVI
jgi:hypothetical protein